MISCRNPVGFLWVFLSGLFLFEAAVCSAELSPQTLAAFDRYTQERERNIEEEILVPSRFLWVDRLPSEERERSYRRLKSGDILIDAGKRVDIPDGLIHHWTGAGFLPGATLAQTLSFIRDYDRHAVNYQPEVAVSRLIERQEEKFHILLRFKKKKVITVVLDTEHEVNFRSMDARRTVSRAHTTRISEVRDAGTPQEKILPPGSGWGFLWKMNTYWRFFESEGGTFVQCETISLSRDVPFAVGWIVGRFVNSVPEESLTFTLSRTREKVLALLPARIDEKK